MTLRSLVESPLPNERESLTPTEEELELTLEAIRASAFPHGNGRTLKEHLTGTYKILKAWKTHRAVSIAGLFHSVYSTEKYKHNPVPLDRRSALAAMLGTESERLVYLFHHCSIQLLTTTATALPRGVANEKVTIKKPKTEPLDLSSQMLWDLLRIHTANLLEQERGQNGWPGIFLWRLSDIQRVAHLHNAVTCPPIADLPNGIELHDEREALDHYRQAFRNTGTSQLAEFARCVYLMPFLAEPNLWYGWALLKAGKEVQAQTLFETSLRCAKRWCATWDKRFTYAQLIRLLEMLRGTDLKSAVLELDALAENWNDPMEALPTTSRAADYLRGIRAGTSLGWYPGLYSARWHDPQRFSVVRSLESMFPDIREEVLKLDNTGFYEEAENIARTGHWKVFMLWEAGRKNYEHCSRLPTLSRILVNDFRVRTTSGLIYLSRLGPGTQVASHRGPTNIRLRLHMPFQVPAGDCAMRVGGEARGWHEGKAVVFDDLYEHEVWNNTTEDRLVLVADLWHSDLDDAEVEFLKSLDIAINKQAESRARYWAKNAHQKVREQAEI